jgi:hypothetical protein
MIIYKNENWLMAEAMERMLARHPGFNGGQGRAHTDELWEKVIAEQGHDPRLTTSLPISLEQLSADVKALTAINDQWTDRRIVS